MLVIRLNDLISKSEDMMKTKNYFVDVSWHIVSMKCIIATKQNESFIHQMRFEIPDNDNYLYRIYINSQNWYSMVFSDALTWKKFSPVNTMNNRDQSENRKKMFVLDPRMRFFRLFDGGMDISKKNYRNDIY